MPAMQVSRCESCTARLFSLILDMKIRRIGRELQEVADQFDAAYEAARRDGGYPWARGVSGGMWQHPPTKPPGLDDRD